MTNNYPYRLNNAFFGTLQFGRRAEIPDPFEVQIKGGIRIQDDNFPERLQVVLRIETVEDPPLSFLIELIGLFDHVEELPMPDRSIIPDFIDNQALYMLWPYIVQIIRNITGQMGTNPITVPTPYSFSLPPEKEPNKDN